MNITHFHVSGFKAVDEPEVKSKNTNLIIVRNNSGKTSLLESMPAWLIRLACASVLRPKTVGSGRS